MIAVMALVTSVAYGMERKGVTIGKIINNSSNDAYLIIPGVQRSEKWVGKRFEELEEPVSLTKSIMLPTLPVYKVKEAYVFHHNDQSEEPLELNAALGEQAFIITETSGQCATHPLRVDNYRELKITPQGVVLPTR